MRTHKNKLHCSLIILIPLFLINFASTCNQRKNSTKATDLRTHIYQTIQPTAQVMETQHQMLSENKEEKNHKNEFKRAEQQSKHHQAQQLNTNPPAASPSSNSSSPSHEFSFTISLQTEIPNKNTNSTPSFAIDLSPADDIFFHGHLLPLHLLSHLPISPRTSTNSIDNFTLPIKESIQENNINDHVIKGKGMGGQSNSKSKSKSKSIFGISSKWRKGCEANDEKNHQEKDQRQRKKFKFDVSRVVKRYMRLVKPFLIFRSNRRMNNHELYRQPCNSFSGNLVVQKNKKELRSGRRRGFSAPVSMRNSPANSGQLVTTSGNVTPTNKSDSTMEELQAAIQAAIAHCKRSTAPEDKIKLP